MNSEYRMIRQDKIGDAIWDFLSMKYIVQICVCVYKLINEVPSREQNLPQKKPAGPVFFKTLQTASPRESDRPNEPHLDTRLPHSRA